MQQSVFETLRLPQPVETLTSMQVSRSFLQRSQATPNDRVNNSPRPAKEYEMECESTNIMCTSHYFDTFTGHDLQWIEYNDR